MALPNTNITQIPEDPAPAAVPSLWNVRYDEIDANFADLDSRMDTAEASVHTHQAQFVEVSDCANESNLGVGTQTGELRICRDTGNIYMWNGNKWRIRSGNIYAADPSHTTYEVLAGTTIFVTDPSPGKMRVSDGSAWTTPEAKTEFPSGTIVIFGQASAPTGYTKVTAWQDNAMLCVNTEADGATLNSGGGANPQSSHVHQTSDHALTINEMPIHHHGLEGVSEGHVSVDYRGWHVHTDGSYKMDTYDEGGGQAHNHGPTVLNTAPYYQEVIAAQKD